MRQDLREEGHWDFAPDLEFTDIETPCHVQEQGERLRAERFYLPLLRELANEAGKPLTSLRVLDDGCGFVARRRYLHSQGIDAVGVDVGWRSQELGAARPAVARCVRADGRALPFADESFDAVVSFGVIEHVGIAGESGVSEEVAPDYQAHRGRYVSEALRVLRSPGVAVLSQPNGAAPWTSGTTPAACRRAGTARGSRSCRASGNSHGGRGTPTPVYTLKPCPLTGCSRSSGFAVWWDGRVLSGVMQAWLAALRRWPLRFFARSPLNPFLVVLLRKPPIRPQA